MKGIDGWDDWDDMYFYDYLTGGNVLGVFRDPKHEDARHPYSTTDDEEDDADDKRYADYEEKPAEPEHVFQRVYTMPTPEEAKKAEILVQQEKIRMQKAKEEEDKRRAIEKAERIAAYHRQADREFGERFAEEKKNERIAAKYSNALCEVLNVIGSLMRG